MKIAFYIAVSVFALTGCATPARVDQMVAKKIDGSKVSTDSPLKKNMAIQGVSGGEPTNPMWLSKVNSDGFKQALESSLKSADFLGEDAAKCNYFLNVRLLSLDQPLFGLDLKVTANVEYVVEEKSSGIKVLNKTVSTPFTATFSDAALAFERLKIANEGAVRENIEKLIEELQSLKIADGQLAIGEIKSSTLVQTQLKELKELFDKGLISKEIYTERQKQILDSK